MHFVPGYAHKVKVCDESLSEQDNLFRSLALAVEVHLDNRKPTQLGVLDQTMHDSVLSLILASAAEYEGIEAPAYSTHLDLESKFTA